MSDCWNCFLDANNYCEKCDKPFCDECTCCCKPLGVGHDVSPVIAKSSETVSPEHLATVGTGGVFVSRRKSVECSPSNTAEAAIWERFWAFAAKSQEWMDDAHFSELSAIVDAWHRLFSSEAPKVAPVAPAVAKEPREWLRNRHGDIALTGMYAVDGVIALMAEYAASLSPQSFDIVLHEREHFRDAYRRKLQEHKETLDLASQLQQRAEAAERSLSRLWIASQKYYSAFGGATEKVCQESREELGKLLTGTEPSDATLLAIDKQERSLETAREALKESDRLVEIYRRWFANSGFTAKDVDRIVSLASGEGK
jgi:hypothetical protein